MKQIRAPWGSWDFDGFFLLLLLLKLTNSTLQYLIQKQKCHTFQMPRIRGWSLGPIRKLLSFLKPQDLLPCPLSSSREGSDRHICLAGRVGSFGHRYSFNTW